MKKNIGTALTLYPTPAVVVGTNVNGKPNWLLVAHIGIIGHNRIMISCAKPHFSSAAIKENRAVSVNIVNEALLPKADYVGSVSGAKHDKSDVFAYTNSQTTGAPMIKDSPLVMDCTVDDIYDSEGFDNFILKIENTFAEESILNENGKMDYTKLAPVLFDMPNYEYLSIGGVIGPCLKMKQKPESR